ncbi:MAG: DUF4339 domain-containing protein [Kiritimatiellae bacterium]|nr:DUF4339 domain-containing protein [Kiritimatiellia bacterium]
MNENYAALEWYCVQRGRQIGPLTWEALRAMAADGRLASDDLVWAEPFGEQWHRMSDVPELLTRSDTIGEVPPPLDALPAAADAGSRPDAASVTPGTKPAVTTPLTGVQGQRPGARAAAADSWHRMRSILFKPFDLARWFSIGFCGWLSFIGGNGCHSNFDPDLLRKGSGGSNEVQLDALFQQVRDWLASHPMASAGMITGIIVGVIIGVLFAVFFLWLRAHGSLMLLHRLSHPRATIRESWHVADRVAPSLFRWRLGLGVCGFLLFAAIVVGAVVSLGVNVLRAGSWQALVGAVTPLWLAGWTGGLVTLLCVWLTLASLSYHFVEPVMYGRQVSVWKAWQTVADLCRQEPGAVLRYYLCQMAWTFLAGTAIVVFILCTCCLGLILLVVPFINATTLLPYLLFNRGLGPSFLARWRPDLLP